MAMSLLSLAVHASTGMSCVQLVKSECGFYHYLCEDEDGSVTDDRGWGCGYRTLQSLCSWAAHRQDHSHKPAPRVPSIHAIQSCLVEVGDKPPSFIGSKEWVGCCEASIVLDHFYEGSCDYGRIMVSCKILHVPSGSEMVNQLGVLTQHFKEAGSPVMIGGDFDSASKTLIGMDLEGVQFLLADPHYHGETELSAMLSGGHVKWHSMEVFQDKSFYNICLPQIP